MNLTELGCQALRLPFIHFVMEVVENFGHGLLPPAVGIALLAFGLIRKNHFYTRAALALLLSVAIAGLTAELLKRGFQIPRPLRDTAGFPSGHASASMSLAAVLGTAFPQWSFVFHLLAFMTCISRLYFRAHSVLDVFAGAGIGLVVGNLIARKLVRPLPQPSGYRIQRAGWALNAVVAVLALSYFLGFEREIRAHRIENAAITNHKEILAVDFGNSEHADFLRSGWSSDAAWTSGGVTAARAYGGTSLMQLALPAASDYLFFLRLNPLARGGTVCPRVEVKINDTRVSRMYLEFGWHWYQIRVPRSAMQQGINQVAFYYTRPESSDFLSNRRQRPPTLAFDMLRIAYDH
jgi:undecaprenyl-diphosphatase